MNTIVPKRKKRKRESLRNFRKALDSTSASPWWQAAIAAPECLRSVARGHGFKQKQRLTLTHQALKAMLSIVVT
ncbi:hypothetical protein [Acidovorax sp. SRB_14]|uniref:hypothetical protein n=1 Tax=Acidovorax sp. SRB_14 TaxID=1962699 RepID=UPI00145D50AF|nr:hypothetical protein [Acidovorax sp. SRB_14]